MQFTCVSVACLIGCALSSALPVERYVPGDEGGREGAEIITAFPDDLTSVFKIAKGAGFDIVVHDYQRKLRYVKPEGKDVCVVIPLKDRHQLDDGDRFAKEEVDPDRKLTKEVIRASFDEERIPNPDFMNQEALEACEGLPVHWSHGSRGKHNFHNKGRFSIGVDIRW